MLAEADSSNNITKYYIHGAGLLAMVTPANEVYTYHFNAVGSTVAMTDSAQNMVNKYSYDPFGNIVNQQESVSQPFKFVGQYGVITEPNGFYYMGARYYDPEVGRFISEDPIGFEGGDTNLMAYVGNQPVNRIDPLGLWKSPYTYKGYLGYLFGVTGGVIALLPGGQVAGAALALGGLDLIIQDTREFAKENIKSAEKALKPVQDSVNELQKELNNQGKGCKK